MVDKETGISSKDVSRRLEKIFGRKFKMGHCGTLDPMASGVLPLVLGSATKIQAFVSASSKTYEFKIELGSNTDTLDADGEVLDTKPVTPIDLNNLQTSLKKMLGKQLQTPPIYSAKKFNGKPLYWYARNGRIDEVDMSRYEREININSLELLDTGRDFIRCRAAVSSGTYIRVLGKDIAKATGNLGHLSELRRTECAGISVDDCVKSKKLTEFSRQQVLETSHCPTSIKLEKLGVISGFSAEDKKLLLFGREIPLKQEYLSSMGLAKSLSSGKTVEDQWILADEENRPFGLGTTRKVGTSHANTIKLFRGF